jgi:endo-1,4-beta-xylanase
MRKTLLIAFSLFSSFTLSAQSTEVPLWPSGAPGSEGFTAKEVDEPPNAQHDYLKVTSIHNPTLTVFLPPAEKATGAAVVICPGGGHRFLAIDLEGFRVAKYLNSLGVAAFVLKYRLAREEGSTYKVEVHALQDARRAIRLVRSRGSEWHVNSSRIGIMGFSAGGELALLAATRPDPSNPSEPDAIDRLSSHPDYQILIYPGVRPDAIQITSDTPPTFLLCADNDKMPSLAIASLYPALKNAGIPTEVHVYNSGGHGFGIREKPNQPLVATTWYLRVGDWMKDRGLLAQCRITIE